MESGPLGWLVVLLGVTAGLLATPHTASAAPRAALQSDGEDGVSPFRGAGQTQAISGGRPATYDVNVGHGQPQASKWPWIAMLRHREYATDNTICGGSLITSRHVLTAAHCLDEPFNQRERIFVRLGEFDSSTPRDGHSTDYEVEAITVHPSYKGKMSNHDIALLRLSKEVQFSAGVCTIPLPDAPTGDLAGHELSLAGWGRTSDSPGPAIASYVLQELDVTAVSEDECYRKWLQMFPTLESHHDFLGGFMKEKKICTQQKKTDQGHCQGDSGGPVVEYGHFRLVGVISTSQYACGNATVPELHTRVSAYLDWILKTVNVPDVKTQHCQNTFLEAA